MMTSDDKRAPTDKSPRGLWLFAAVCCVVLVQVVYGILVFRWFPQMDGRGQFGDLFGGVNALFTGLAFAGVIYTILLQRWDLEVQREELRLNTAELRRSAEAQTQQESRLKEAAELSAKATLVEIYRTRLQPWWEKSDGLRMEIAYKELILQDSDANETQKAEANAKLQDLRKNLEIQQKIWLESTVQNTGNWPKN
jgi:hypothetical protein